jgi:hypothetical protein
VPHPKHDQVRARWNARCGYCGVTEEDVGGDLTVDHFVPVVAGGGESDENLVYACFRCNLFKGEFHPTSEDRTNGRVVLHPLCDDVSKHLCLEETTGKLQALTETGPFHIAILRLNRKGLVAFRLRRRFFELVLERRGLVEAGNSELRAIIKAQEKYIAYLRRLVQSQEDVSDG